MKNANTKKTMKMKNFAVIFILLLLMTQTQSALAGPGKSITISANTKWSAISSGSGTNGIPNSSDFITVSSGDTLTIDVTNASCSSLILGGNAGTTSTVIIASNKSLTVNYGFQFGFQNQSSINSSRLIMNPGSLLSAGWISVGGNSNVTTPYSHTFVASTGTIVVNSGTYVLPTFLAYYNLSLSKTAKVTLDGNLTVNGDLNIASGCTLDPTSNNYNLIVNGNFINNGTLSSQNNLVTFSGTQTQTISGNSTTAFYNLTINNASHAVKTASNITVSNTLTVNSGDTLKPGASNTIGGTGTLTGYGKILVTAIGNTNDYVTQYPISSKTLTNLTIVFAGASAQAMNASVTPLGWVNANTSSTVTYNATIAATTNGTKVNDSAILVVASGYTLPDAVTGPVTGTGTLRVMATGNANDLTAQYTGSLTTNNLKIDYAGAAAQNLATGTYKYFNINNSHGTTLIGDVSLSGGLSIMSGNVALGKYNLTLNSGASVTGGSSNNYIKIMSTGTLIAKGVTSITVPIGDEYAPVTITNGGGADYTFSLVNGITDRSNNPILNHGVGITWKITASKAVSNVGITLQWPAANELIAFDRTKSYITYRTLVTNPWNPIGVATAAIGTDPYTQTATMPSMAAGTMYYFGVGDNGSSALPVTLTLFTAVYADNQVNLNWHTASEINNSHFEIERSTTGTIWMPIGNVHGNGTTQEAKNYSAIDNLNGVVPTGTFYYRLKQVDFNGNFEYSPIRSVTITASHQSFEAYPNPVINTLTVNYNNDGLNPVTIRISNLAGTVLCTGIMNGAGLTKSEVDMSAYPAGVYMLQISNGQKIDSKMIVKNK